MGELLRIEIQSSIVLIALPANRLPLLGTEKRLALQRPDLPDELHSVAVAIKPDQQFLLRSLPRFFSARL
ncbi:hypothetical protein [Gordonia rubripertincta]|uniref:hypothetical protein n=1 Tax=Gordonia rubripertincta TaxID=36822 RepID=UPI000B8D60D3|nr:hypothetical protein [Gordonia rubripertincta]ASR03236.1 hypothetical protein GCWB2_12195 [Gordonia rubripertincta]